MNNEKIQQSVTNHQDQSQHCSLTI